MRSSILRGLYVLLCLQFMTSGMAQPLTDYDTAGWYTGFEDILYTEVNDTKAYQLKQVFSDSFGITDFRVYGADLWPSLVHVNPDEGFRLMYSDIINELNLAQEPFLLICKEQTKLDVDLDLKYRVHIKWPSHQAFDTLIALRKEVIRARTEDVLNAEWKTDEELDHNPAIEGKGLDFLKSNLLEILAKSFKINAQFFLDAGFEEVSIEGQQIDSDGTPLLAEYDYAGLMTGTDYLRDLSDLAYIDLLFSATAIYTDNDNIPSGDFELASQNFETLQSEMLVSWFHFFEGVDGDKMFIKYRVNVTYEEAMTFLQQKYDELLDNLQIFGEGEEGGSAATGSDDKLQLRTSEDCAYNCNECDNPTWQTWRAKTCIIPLLCCTGSNTPTDLAIRALINSPNFSEYDVGTASGIIDGIYELVLLLYDLSSGIKKAATHLPLTKEWFYDLAYESNKAGHFWKGFENKWTKDKAYWIDGLVNFLDAVSKLNTAVILKGVRAMLDEFWGNVSGVNGPALVGYQAGKIVFEVVIEFLTGGVAGAKKIASFSKEALEKFIDLISKPNAPDFKGLFDNGIKNLKGISGQLIKTKTQLLAARCFVAGTLVMTAPGEASAIQQLTLGTPIVTQIVPDQVDVLASGTVDLHDLISREQLRVDETSDRSTWYHIDFTLVEDGDLARISLLRPRWWVRERGCFEVGANIYLALPEQNISGHARLLSISKINFPEVGQKKNLTEGHQYQIITGKFERTSSNVRRLIFDNGEELFVTGEHPIYSESAGGWKEAALLEPGEIVRKYGGTVVLRSSEKLDTVATVYNLEVREDHTFHVGSSGILVHNAYQISVAKLEEVRDKLQSGQLLIRQDAMTDELFELLYDDAVFDKFVLDFGGSGIIDDFPLRKLEAWKGLFKTGLRTDVNWLSTVNTWLDEGVEVIDDVLPVQFMHNGDEIAKIVDDKLIPTKFQFDGTVINEVKLSTQDFGKDVVKATDGIIGFRYQFKRTKVYRAMSNAEWQATQNAGEFVSTGEAFISTNKAYSQSYVGTPGYDVLVEFDVAENTIQDLAKIGVKDHSSLVPKNGFDDLQEVYAGWPGDGKTYFKKETRPGTSIEAMTIGLKSQAGKNSFNGNLSGFQIVN